jgi:hypothetical protein
MPISDPTAARLLVYNVVVNWVGGAVGIPPTRVNVARTFKGAPTGGYGFNEGRFLQMCDEITPSIAIPAGRALKLPGKFRVDHEDDVIAVFIDAVATRLLASPLTASGARAHQFVAR